MRRIAAGACAALLMLGCGDRNRDARESAAGEVAGRDAATGAGGVLLASVSEWKVDLPVDTVAPRRYTFLVRNAGKTAHALKVEGSYDNVVKSTSIDPNGTQEITLDLSATPGIYEVFCPLKDANGEHKDKGMRRWLIVRAR
jgi:hypothetical protein